MAPTKRDIWIAGLTPWLIIVIFIAMKYVGWAAPLVLYVIYHSLKQPLAKEVCFKLFDLFLSLFLLSIFFGVIIGALLLVAKDGDFPIPGISDGLLKDLLLILLAAYMLFSLIKTNLLAFKGQTYQPKLSMGICEALRGKQAVIGDKNAI